MIDLGWAAYGEAGKISHRWEFDQRLGVLRSVCRSVYRRTESCSELFMDDAKPQCRTCIKRAKV